jgi:hypothetical protein
MNAQAIIYAQAIVQTDIKVARLEHLLSRLREVEADSGTVEDMISEVTEGNLALNAYVALLGTVDGEYPEGTETFVGKIVRAYSIVADTL